ncbi:MAG: hypothetical protein ACE5HE_06035 [Phycisphaerae bacterium]
MNGVGMWRVRALCILGLLAAPVYPQVQEWVPVTATGNFTINGNQIVLQGGGQTVTLHLLLSGWDPNSTGVLLGSFQGTIDPASYLGANANPPNPGVDLNPLGWPLTPTDGAFQAVDVCGNLDCLFDPTNPACDWDEFSNCAVTPCPDPPDPRPFCFERPDWVFSGGNYVETVTTDSLSYGWSAASTSCRLDPDAGVTKFYGGTLQLEVPVGAQGTYTISLVDDINFTLMTTCVGILITPITRIPAEISIACATNADCDDGNVCTDDVCLPDETCSNTPNYNDVVFCCDPLTGALTTIDDGNECTSDTCNPDGSVDHTPTPDIACGSPPVGECDAQDTCNTLGECSPVFVPAGTLCGDTSTSECDFRDTCDGAGTCQPNHATSGTACGDPSDTDCTDPDICDGLGACQPNDVADGSACDDLDACTVGETCTGGVCSGGSAVDCDDGLSCTTDTCNQGTGLCDNTLDPGNCLIGGACYAGGEFNPSNDCEECDAAAPLVWSFRAPGATCDDGDPCTGTGRPGIGVDTCDGAGVCSGLDDPECNDTCPFAIEASLGVTFSNNDNRGPDDAEASCQVDSNNDVWFFFTAFCDGEVLLTTDGSTFAPSNDPVLSVWSACPDAGGIEIACDDDSGVDLHAALTFPASVGGTYYIRVAGFEDNSGDIMLNISVVNDCVIDGVCYQETELNPDNECQACIPALSTTAWSSVLEGTACGDPTDTVCDSPDACDGAGNCEANPKPDGTECPDDGNVCSFDVCSAGACTHPPTPAGTVCGDPTDTECDNPDSCDGAGTCLDNFEQAGAPCGDPGMDQCDNPDICDGNGSCDNNYAPAGTPCDDGEICTGADVCFQGGCAGTPIAEQPIVLQEGSRSFSIVAQPVEPVPPVAFLVTSPDWPCLSKYVGATECGGNGQVCSGDADCNRCSYSFEPCLADADCDHGRCTDGRDCSVGAQDCLDASTCVRDETCLISGDLCEPAPLRPIDINADGLFDGLRATLVDDPSSATVMPLADWTVGLMRCTKSAAACTADSDCPRGVCDNGIFCNVPAQNCFDGSTCVLDEQCLPGRVFLTGHDVVPSTQYNVVAECGAFLTPPGSASTCLWADVNCDGFVNVTDVQLAQLGFQGFFEFATLVQIDIHPCYPQGVINVSDIQRVVLALQGQTYDEIGCRLPCPFQP